jgi:bile acid:Na+ symporter, BASS family
MTTGILLPIGLATIMFALGLTLTVGDFARVFAQPRAIAVGLLVQVMMVPLLAFLIATAMRLPPELAMGLMLLAACPSGASAGLITHLSGGKTALSISLTAITSVLAVISTPLVVNYALFHFAGTAAAMELPIAKMIRGMFLITPVPVALGMAMRHTLPALTARIEPVAGRIAILVFLSIVVATFVDQRQVLATHITSIGPAALLLNLAVMAAGVGLAAGFGLEVRDRIAIAVEAGMQNAALGIFLAVGILAVPAMAVPSVVYALLMNLTAIGFILFMRRSRRRSGGEPDATTA